MNESPHAPIRKFSQTVILDEATFDIALQNFLTIPQGDIQMNIAKLKKDLGFYSENQ